MFTGIVSGVGRVAEVRKAGIAIEHAATAARLQPGSSVAVNGCCLTAVEVNQYTFYADTVEETRRRTNLGSLRKGSEVNLELPLTLAQGLDGHMVQGHVDATAEIKAINENNTGAELDVALPKELAPFVVEKGSIAIDGASLTVVHVSNKAFRVALIPHTLAHTIARTYRQGTLVNLEVDMVARYVHRLIELK